MDRKTIEDIINGGLFTFSDEPFFSWHGCSYCESGGATVYECSGYRNLAERRAGCANLYEFNLCGECRQWVLNDEGLYSWARSEGVAI